MGFWSERGGHHLGIVGVYGGFESNVWAGTIGAALRAVAHLFESTAGLGQGKARPRELWGQIRSRRWSRVVPSCVNTVLFTPNPAFFAVNEAEPMRALHFFGTVKTLC